MRHLRSAWIAVFLALLWAASPASLAQKKSSSSKKRTTAARNKTTAKSTKKSTAKSAKKSTKKKTTTARRRTRSTRRPSFRAGPQQPTSERYKEIQSALADRGYFSAEADGKWGEESADALKRFQTDQNLKPDGKLDSLSLIALGLGPKRGVSGSLGPPESEVPGALERPPVPEEPPPAQAAPEPVSPQ